MNRGDDIPPVMNLIAGATASSSDSVAPSTNSTSNQHKRRVSKDHHPLLDAPIVSPYDSLQALYDRHGGTFDGIRMDIDETLSSANFKRAIQFRVVTTRAFTQGELITPYGGIPVSSKEYCDGGIAAGCPLTHARSIPNTSFVLDGLPFARMVQRPIPDDADGLQRIIADGIEVLMPTVKDGFTPEQIRAFRRSPIGYMINTASAKEVNCRIQTVSIADGTTDIPFIYASRSIPSNEELFCSYHNNEQQQLIKGESSTATTAPQVSFDPSHLQWVNDWIQTVHELRQIEPPLSRYELQHLAIESFIESLKRTAGVVQHWEYSCSLTTRAGASVPHRLRVDRSTRYPTLQGAFPTRDVGAKNIVLSPYPGWVLNKEQHNRCPFVITIAVAAQHLTIKQEDGSAVQYVLIGAPQSPAANINHPNRGQGNVEMSFKRAALSPPVGTTRGVVHADYMCIRAVRKLTRDQEILLHYGVSFRTDEPFTCDYCLLKLNPELEDKARRTPTQLKPLEKAIRDQLGQLWLCNTSSISECRRGYHLRCYKRKYGVDMPVSISCEFHARKK
jgi:hypothetical protein